MNEQAESEDGKESHVVGKILFREGKKPRESRQRRDGGGGDWGEGREEK